MMRMVVAPGLLLAAASATAAPVPGKPAPQDVFALQFPARILAAHNRERVVLGVPPLVWDNALGSGAALYAQQMAATGITQHSDRKARPGIGENLWWGTHNAFRVETMVADWASEKRMFAPGFFPANSRTGNWIDVAHYTQMIWPTTLKVGCALATNGAMDYLVCRYSPKGNIDGRWVGYLQPQRN